jgi:hypothetical protein
MMRITGIEIKLPPAFSRILKFASVNLVESHSCDAAAKVDHAGLKDV